MAATCKSGVTRDILSVIEVDTLSSAYTTDRVFAHVELCLHVHESVKSFDFSDNC